MKSVETKTITLTNQLSMNSLISFVKQAKSFDSHVSLYRNGYSINGKKLSSVITFNLTVKENDSILIITDGVDASHASEHLIEWLKKEMDLLAEQTLSPM
ncbi:HPr family phosphocarrier protein [Pseudalkalibacillus hwajinpoensis]|uniref:HPr family phosphocarrier protein n=1 Tax=Guptibacillus hwajinpoensis TaxID=208199 RepID=UPI00325B6354